jgi:hypothetical protein
VRVEERILGFERKHQYKVAESNLGCALAHTRLSRGCGSFVTASEGVISP